jgi:uncharacterized protein YfaA (DUF2138 family)
MMSFLKNPKKRLLLLIPLVVFVALGAWYVWPWAAFASGPLDPFSPDIEKPDALIRTDSLSRLPSDLLKVPLARDVLTEDFVTYYEQNESRLALSGTVRRIAFEHKLDLPEKLIESAFNEAAEVALWRGADGRLQYFALLITRNALARAVQTMLPVLARATDLQLSSAGKLDGTNIDILVLEYGYKHRLLLLSKDDKVVALSEPGMLLVRREGQPDAGKSWKQSPAAVKVVRSLLGGKKTSVFASHFNLKPASPGQHELVLGSRGFAFGYEKFAPGLEALSLSFDDKGTWQSAALLARRATVPEGTGGALWDALPHGPSLCAALPVDWRELVPLLKTFNDSQKQAVVPAWFIDRFADVASVCWYKDSRLYTPLFAARLKGVVDDQQAQEFFALAAASTQAGEGKKYFHAGGGQESGVGDQGSGEARFLGGEKVLAIWQGSVASSFGASEGGNGGERQLKPALAIRDDVVFFSPDAKLVENALDVAAKRFPALADSFADADDNHFSTLAFIDPAALAALLRKETFAALPRSEEALFRNAADAYLVPRLDALARFPAQRIGWTAAAGKDREWHVLTWETEAKAASH